MERKANQNYIKAIAQVRSISMAAENLGISQPALSAYLKKQEKELGCMLFDRSRQPIELTEGGRVYLDYLDKAAALEKEMNQNLADIEELQTGRLTIGGASFFNTAHLPKAVVAFAGEYPGINLEIVDGKVPELITMAEKGMLDLFITPTAEEDDRFEFEEFLEERIFLAVPAEWEINGEMSGKAVHAVPSVIETGGVRLETLEIDKGAETLTQKEFEQFCGYTFVVLKKNQHIGRKMEELFQKFGCRPKQVITAEQTMTTLALTDAGAGISLITESSIRHGNFKRLPALYMADDRICRRKMYIAYPKSKYLSRAADRFKEMLKEVNRA